MADRPVISIEETILFLLFNFILIFFGIVIWYFLWINKFGAELPRIYNDTTINFSSRNPRLVIEELYSRIMTFDTTFLTKSIGHEACVYLLFQKKVISVIFTYFIVSMIFSLINSLIQMKSYNKENILIMIYQFFVDNQLFSKSTSQTLQIISISLITFLHFRCFSIIKKEAQYLYFNRFDKMSQKFDSDWLSCRTMHISGIGPNERNSKSLIIYIYI